MHMERVAWHDANARQRCLRRCSAIRPTQHQTCVIVECVKVFTLISGAYGLDNSTNRVKYRIDETRAPSVDNGSRYSIWSGGRQQSVDIRRWLPQANSQQPTTNFVGLPGPFIQNLTHAPYSRLPTGPHQQHALHETKDCILQPHFPNNTIVHQKRKANSENRPQLVQGY